MIRNPHILAAFERERIRTAPIDYHRNLAILDAMYAQAIRTGALPLKDPLEDIETKFQIARALNVRLPSDTPGKGL